MNNTHLEKFLIFTIYQNYTLALMRDSDWLKLKLHLIFLICVQIFMQRGHSRASGTASNGSDPSPPPPPRKILR